MAKASPSISTWTNTDAYEAVIGRWSQPAAQAALAWLGLSPGLAWLDVGCGTGALTRAILETSSPREVLGVDPSAEFLAVAAERLRDSRVRFEVGDAESLAVEDNRFDVAISGLVLHFVPDPRAAVVESTRTVRDGGTVAAYFWASDDQRQFTRLFWRAASEVDPASSAWDPRTRFSVRDSEAFSALWVDAGLQEATADGIDFPVVFRDFDDYWQPCLLDGTSPIQLYTRTLGAEQRAALRERLRELLPVASDGSITLIGRILIARGIK